MRNRKRKTRMRIYGITGAALLAAVVIAAGVFISRDKTKKDSKLTEPTQQTAVVDSQMETQTQTGLQTEMQEETQAAVPTTTAFDYAAVQTDATASFPKSVVSKQGILIDVDAGTILAKKGAFKRMVPASMTKIFTVLVAAENITPQQWNDMVTISLEATDFSYRNDCSNTGYAVDEQVPVRDLFYGTILPSGADAAVSLATYVSGSQEAFVDLMNDTLEKMGLSKTTHFTNCVGIYNDDHYSTPYDMAMILKAAMDNPLCRQVLGTRTYTTTQTDAHPDGITVSNWFLRRIEDKDTHSEIIGAKTGFVNQSGSCAASMAQAPDGKEYICVTAGSTSSWRCIYDHVDIYDAFLPETAQTAESSSAAESEAVTQE